MTPKVRFKNNCLSEDSISVAVIQLQKGLLQTTSFYIQLKEPSL